MKKLFQAILIVSSFISFSQIKTNDTITRKATIGYDKKGNLVSFKPETPPLFPIAGAPAPSYTYFWELGDGSYSKEKEPKKIYKKKGEYKVNLSVTNNYDNGKPPKTRPKIVSVTDITNANFENIASVSDTTSIHLFVNRQPVPEEEMVVVVSYQNLLHYVANGKLYLFYNDKEFKNKNFELLETRTHFNENEIQEVGIVSNDDSNKNYLNIASTNDFASFSNNFSTNDENLELTLAESKMLYSDVKIFEFNEMDPSETRNIFFNFKTTPEMIKDTSAIVKMRGVYVPDRNYKTHKKKTLEMEIVTSHDPNKMSSNAAFMNYRLVRFKTLHFKTRFQNNGEGPARKIKLETDIPEMFDKKTLKIIDNYPKCPICPKDEEVNYSCMDTIILKDQIHFVFKNIYLPGSQQKNVKEFDSTKGFVKYSMKFAKDFHKIKTKSRTAIIFDKNEPVITNYATTRFLPGISIGAKAGYNFFPEQENGKSYFVGATVSPFKSYRFYWQAELSYNYLESKSSNVTPLQFQAFNPPIQLTNGTVLDVGYTQASTSSELIITSADVVPISLRYNINNYIGVGAGPQFSVVLNSTIKNNSITKYYYPVFNQNPPGVGDEITGLQENTSSEISTKALEKMQTSFFADVTFGFARIGPSAGIRYYINLEKDFNYWQFYAIWKF